MIVRSGKESAGSDADTSPSCLRRRIWAKASWSSPFLFKDVFFGGAVSLKCGTGGENVSCDVAAAAREQEDAGQKAPAAEDIGEAEERMSREWRWRLSRERCGRKSWGESGPGRPFTGKEGRRKNKRAQQRCALLGTGHPATTVTVASFRTWRGWRRDRRPVPGMLTKRHIL